MIAVVLTGPAVDAAGQQVLRSNLITACEAKGIAVQKSVRADTKLLVASRLDTVKAKAAFTRGMKVLTYPQFIAKYLGNEPLPTDGPAHRIVDKMPDKKKPVGPVDKAALVLKDTL